MDAVTIISLAVALAMDAFSVSIAAGMIINRPTYRHYFRLAFHFGLFQFMMPVAGYFAGTLVERWIREYDHWVALALLAYIGTRMIRESYSPEGPGHIRKDPSRGWSLVLLSVATSIDALAVGLSIGVMAKPILFTSVVIGITCALFSVTGIAIGKRAGALLGRRVERIGGIILVTIGIRIVVEHMGG
jgi:putative Mn2+ efflux pump MntP